MLMLRQAQHSMTYSSVRDFPLLEGIYEVPAGIKYAINRNMLDSKPTSNNKARTKF